MKNKLLAGFVLIVGVSAIVLSALALKSQKKMAWFDYNKVYNECQLKVDLENNLEKVVSARKSELDSMQLELSFMSTKIQNGQANNEELIQFEDMKNRFLTFQNRYEEENIRLKEEYFAQIRANINDKSKTFAEDKGYHYFFSAVGDGSLMYAKDSEDVTDEFLNYVNQ